MLKILTYNLLISLFIIMLLGCKEESDLKHLELQKRDSLLTVKEKEFALKAADYKSLLELRDSLTAMKDSVAVNPLPVDITGNWTGKIVCTHSNCTDYVVGDVRTDEWNLSVDDGKIAAKNINKTGVIRMYTGEYDGTRILLASQNTPDAPVNRSFKIEFGTVSAERLAGTREIQVDQSCTSQFSIELVRK
ncbi:hypothetical protein H1R16_08235 [Marnyiella aurantia]|uniref:Uncharacterized protein n=1 Tax=Marnyiella aurantia TaxID=2758037 RepID=A0A7D7QV14_9FLAO|nr:hypothetical protein [Marnyiella aurantia]MBA5246952.1 hypothetical protein [Marnyiella aurantia]QMS97710.1 hypothetical protein H1R16_08235 [Marnyiella aurantia]